MIVWFMNGLRFGILLRELLWSMWNEYIRRRALEIIWESTWSRDSLTGPDWPILDTADVIVWREIGTGEYVSSYVGRVMVHGKVHVFILDGIERSGWSKKRRIVGKVGFLIALAMILVWRFASVWFVKES